MLPPLCVSLRRRGEPVGRASPAWRPDSNDIHRFLDGKDSRPCREISDGLTLLALRDSLLVVSREFRAEFFTCDGDMICGNGNVDLAKALLAGQQILR
jgi:hypothetical protein